MFKSELNNFPILPNERNMQFMEELKGKQHTHTHMEIEWKIEKYSGRMNSGR